MRNQIRTLAAWLNPSQRGRWPTFWCVALFWSPLVGMVFTALFNRYDSFIGYLFDLGISLVIATCSIVVCFAIGIAVEWLEIRIRARSELAPREHGKGWHLLMSAPGLPLGVWLGLRVVEILYQVDLLGSRSLLYGVVVGTVVMLAFFAHEVAGDLRDARRALELRSRDVETARLKGEVSALTAQMNPHLLFNALNTIASLTQNDADAAEDMTVELADLYRSVLRAARCETHPLADELDICRSYLSIEKARFGDRIRYSIDTDDAERSEVRVPPLLLQPLATLPASTAAPSSTWRPSSPSSARAIAAILR